MQDSFNISKSYTVTYSDSTSGSSCGSATIPASSCEGGVCNYGFDHSSSPCRLSPDITLAAFAANILGDGPSSEPVRIFMFSYVQHNYSKLSYISSTNSSDDITHVHIDATDFPACEKLGLTLATTFSSIAYILSTAIFIAVVVILVRKFRESWSSLETTTNI